MSLGSRPAGLSSSLLSVKVSSFLEANRGYSAGSRLARNVGLDLTRNAAQMLLPRRHDAKSRWKIYSSVSVSYEAARRRSREPICAAPDIAENGARGRENGAFARFLPRGSRAREMPSWRSQNFALCRLRLPRSGTAPGLFAFFSIGVATSRQCICLNAVNREKRKFRCICLFSPSG